MRHAGPVMDRLSVKEKSGKSGGAGDGSERGLVGPEADAFIRQAAEERSKRNPPSSSHAQYPYRTRSSDRGSSSEQGNGGCRLEGGRARNRSPKRHGSTMSPINTDRSSRLVIDGTGAAGDASAVGMQHAVDVTPDMEGDPSPSHPTPAKAIGRSGRNHEW